MDWNALGLGYATSLLFLAVFVALFFVAKLLKDFLTPYKVIDVLAIEDNPAVGLTIAGYLLATAIIYLGVVFGPGSGDLMADLLGVVLYSLLGLVFLNLSRWVMDKFIFRTFCNMKALFEDRNMSMGAVRFGAYIATGLVAAASVNGEGGGPETAIAFFVLGQLCLIVFAWIYDKRSKYDLEAEIEKGNVAAGVAFGGTLVALGLIIAHGSFGDFESWAVNLQHFALSVVIGIVVLQIARLFMDRLVLPGHDLNKEIAEDRNLAAGFLEVSVALGFALVLVALL